MLIRGFICCPRCGGNTHIKVKDNTELKNFPLWCKNCKQETMIDFKAGALCDVKKGA